MLYQLRWLVTRVTCTFLALELTLTCAITQNGLCGDAYRSFDFSFSACPFQPHFPQVLENRDEPIAAMQLQTVNELMK